MNNMTKSAACQLYEIINQLPNEEKSKIPENVIVIIDEKKDGYILTNNEFVIDDINLTEETKKYLAYIFLNYLASENEKDEYEKIISENERRYQKKLSEKYSTQNLFSKKEVEKLEVLEITTDLTTSEKLNWWEKILEKIKDLFKRK